MTIYLISAYFELTFWSNFHVGWPPPQTDFVLLLKDVAHLDHLDLQGLPSGYPIKSRISRSFETKETEAATSKVANLSSWTRGWRDDWPKTTCFAPHLPGGFLASPNPNLGMSIKRFFQVNVSEWFCFFFRWKTAKFLGSGAPQRIRNSLSSEWAKEKKNNYHVFNQHGPVVEGIAQNKPSQKTTEFPGISHHSIN